MNKLDETRHIITSRIVRALAAGIAAGCVITAIPTASLAERLTAASSFSNDSAVKSYESQLATIEQNLKSIRSSIAQTAKDIKSAQQIKTNLDKELSLLYDQIEVQTALLAELKLAIEEKNVQISDKQTEYDEKYALLLERLRVTREDGEASYLAMLLGADSLADFLSRADRISAMLEYDMKIMADLEDNRHTLEDNRTELMENMARQEQIAADLQVNKAAIEQKAVENANYLASLQSDSAEYQAMQEQNEKLREEFEAKLEERIKELEKQNSKYVGGTLLWPVPLEYTRITSECGWRDRVFGAGQEYHNGCDIPVPYGTDIYAANTGTVVTATDHWSYGNYIMIDHGGGIITLYAHNSKLLVKVGDKVTRGQVIAKAGSTGQSTGNHLHFSIRENGAWVNHRKYFGG